MTTGQGMDRAGQTGHKPKTRTGQTGQEMDKKWTEKNVVIIDIYIKIYIYCPLVHSISIYLIPNHLLQSFPGVCAIARGMGGQTTAPQYRRNFVSGVRKNLKGINYERLVTRRINIWL